MATRQERRELLDCQMVVKFANFRERNATERADSRFWGLLHSLLHRRAPTNVNRPVPLHFVRENSRISQPSDNLAVPKTQIQNNQLFLLFPSLQVYNIFSQVFHFFVSVTAVSYHFLLLYCCRTSLECCTNISSANRPRIVRPRSRKPLASSRKSNLVFCF